MKIENRLRGLRKNAGLSQKELAKTLAISQPTVCAWEKGEKEPSSKSAAKLADYFGVSMDYLLGRSDNSSPQKEQPIISENDGLFREVIQLLLGLSDSDLRRVEDFVAGLKACRGADAAVRQSGPPVER